MRVLILVFVVVALTCGCSAAQGRKLHYVEIGSPVASAADAPVCFRPLPGADSADSCFHFLGASSADNCAAAAAAWDYNGNCFGTSTILYRFEDDGSRRWGTCALILPASCQSLLTNPPSTCRVGSTMCNGTLADEIDAFLAQPLYDFGPVARLYADVPGPPTPPSPQAPPTSTGSGGDGYEGNYRLPEAIDEIIDNIG